jgi:hypothetical protein
VAIQFRVRREELIAEARRYARALYDEATDDDGGEDPEGTPTGA